MFAVTYLLPVGLNGTPSLETCTSEQGVTKGKGRKQRMTWSNQAELLFAEDGPSLYRHDPFQETGATHLSGDQRSDSTKPNSAGHRAASGTTQPTNHRKIGRAQ